MLVGVAQLAAVAARLLGAPPRDDGPSTLVEAEHPRARRALAAWLREAQERLSRVQSLLQVEDALAIMHGSSHVRQLAGITWRTAMLASLLGARDALDEVEGREPVSTPDRFEAFSGGLELDVDRKVGTHTDPIKPFWEALDKFAGRSPANKHEWNMMVAAERERAFTAAVATSREMVGQIQTVVFDALANGHDLKWFRRELKAKVVDIADHQANVILRNAQATSYAQGRMVTMTAPHVVLARPYWQVLTADDGPPRQRPTHRAIHGWVMRADDPGWQKTNPPHGHNCFIATTRVSGMFLGAARSRYRGPSVQIVTDGGRMCRVTVGHPVLTPKGLVLARDLVSGAEVVCAPEHGEQAQNAYARIRQDAVSARQPTSVDDFHGEAARFIGESDMVGSYVTGDAAMRTCDPRDPAHVVDRVKRVKLFDVDGFVYDFQTTSGLVVAGGIVTSNCRCRLVARSRAWVEKNAPTLWSGPFPNLPDPGWTCVAPPPVELPDVL